MKKKMIPLLLLLPLLFLLAVYGKDSKKEEAHVVVIAIDGLRWQEVFEGARRDSLMPFLWEDGQEEGLHDWQPQPEIEDGDSQRHLEILCRIQRDALWSNR